MQPILADFDAYHYLFSIPLALVSIFLTLVILVQRGRGGGLTGALGGMGGQSAFGTKAGDLFTRITIGLAIFWACLAMGTIYFGYRRANPFGVTSTQGTKDGKGEVGKDKKGKDTKPADDKTKAGTPAEDKTDGKEKKTDKDSETSKKADDSSKSGDGKTTGETKATGDATPAEGSSK